MELITIQENIFTAIKQKLFILGVLIYFEIFSKNYLPNIYNLNLEDQNNLDYAKVYCLDISSI